MRMRLSITTALLATFLLPAAAQAADCVAPQLLNSIHLKRAAGGRAALVPVTVNGTQADFLFDTGGFYTQVAAPMVEKLKLEKRPGAFELSDSNGNVSHEQVRLKEFVMGSTSIADSDFPVSPNRLPVDGIVALDRLLTRDMEVNFSTDTLNFFSQDRCPGQGVPWTSAAPDSVAITMERFHVTVPVMLDGHAEQAVIDTGASSSSLSAAEAVRLFHLKIGSDDAPETGIFNGDPNLKVYSHLFNSLTLGNYTMKGPNILLIPAVTGGAKTDKPRTAPVMIIGMDMLRKLHLYVAFKESKLYFTDLSAAQPAAPPP